MSPMWGQIPLEWSGWLPALGPLPASDQPPQQLVEPNHGQFTYFLAVISGDSNSMKLKSLNKYLFLAWFLQLSGEEVLVQDKVGFLEVEYDV